MKKGFTIIETLVAITILMIAIAGPLVVASKGLTSAIYSKDQMTATFLAQESMEAIKNRRDNNMSDPPAPDWLDGLSANCDTANHRCGASALDSTPFIQGCGLDGCQVYFLNGIGYSNNSGGGATATIFKRYYYLESKTNNSAPEVQVNVVVNWKEGAVPYQVQLTSELVNSSR